MTKLVDHCLNLYDELEKRAKRNDAGVLVFEGKITRVMTYLGISTTYHTVISRTLSEMRSIETVQRGTGMQPSRVILHGRPDRETLQLADLTSPRRLATMAAEAEKRLDTLDKWRESIPPGLKMILLDYEERIVQLEKTVSAAISNQSSEGSGESRESGEND